MSKAGAGVADVETGPSRAGAQGIASASTRYGDAGSPPALRDKVTVLLADGSDARRAAAVLEELIEPPAVAVSCFEEAADSWRVEAYFAEAPELSSLAVQLTEMAGLVAPDLQHVMVPDENWVAISQAALPPVAAGRFTVHGSHDRERVPRGPFAIEIDAGEAFGTAHHATTSGCLAAIDTLARRRRRQSQIQRQRQRHMPRVLDLGCGSGVLAIAAARLAPRGQVVASDIDPIAVEVAHANARRNGATGIECLVSDGVPRPRRGAGGRFDLVIANILAGPLVRLAPALARTTAPGGRLVLSGLLVRQAREVLGAYLPRGFALERRIEIAGWATLVLLRRT